MKTSFVSFLALASSVVSVLAAPAAPVASIQKRDFDPTALVNTLAATIQPSLVSINTTSASITPTSTDDEKAAAASAISSDVATIAAAISAAQAQVPTTNATTVTKRQSDTDSVAAAAADLIVTISNTADSVVAAFGVAQAQTLLDPIGSSLSALLLALEVVVNDLLAVVQELVDSILTGLSTGLAGITI